MMNVAVLRAINVAGHQGVPMSDLQAFFEDLGFEDVKTLLQSGNVVFRGNATEDLLEREARKRLGLATDFFVRSAKEWKAIVDRNPFAREASDDPGRLVAAVLKGRGSAFEWPGPEIVRVDDSIAYIYYPNGQGRSKLNAATLDRKLGTRVTARNWNTIMKIAAALH
jgi:uncharacterized protein (DUF1697 family)